MVQIQAGAIRKNALGRRGERAVARDLSEGGQEALLSDVPVGFSSVVDGSGLLLGLMNESGSGWPTYTIGYGKDFKDDELMKPPNRQGSLGATHIH
jgi:hypothetical protein